ncbi:MAG TPA: bifunctional diaminohydroxyphosphoribosylaminopyrimidine deaminase/5-amino-6-(5-phosphoribosylamino)uracil reductase RibD [Fibrobacteria bacterium]|nr:bifunctional diaminohydroxyphosphoribosylaminopyrimidine deaminase/5-amino-6-(5-phosphoribosylamino)uracil reductase RibD [Fibrobacteria bacterium]
MAAQTKSQKLMEKAFLAAKSVKGSTLPNPPVGAIFVKNGLIIASGATRPAGGPHAEIVGLRKALGEAAGSTLYVTLEPCAHFGRTPPCARALVEAGVRKVVAACEDPNPKVAGKGFEELRRAGIEVVTGVLREQAEEFYAPFFFYMRHGRPRIVAKIAQSLDGRINAAPGRETAITGKEARRFAHALRARADAILIGGSTLRIDDPDLTPRLTGGAAPHALVLTRRRRLDPKLRVFAAGRKSGTTVLSAHASTGLPDRIGHFRLAREGGKPLVDQLMGFFAERGYHEVLLEGGRGVWSPFLEAGLCDILHVVTASVLLPGGEAWSAGLAPRWAKPLEIHRFTPLGQDILAEFRRRMSG